MTKMDSVKLLTIILIVSLIILLAGLSFWAFETGCGAVPAARRAGGLISYPSSPFHTKKPPGLKTGRLRAYCHQSMSSPRIPRPAETAIADQNAPLMSATAARTIMAMCRFFMLSPPVNGRRL